jgi:hypothetical protein
MCGFEKFQWLLSTIAQVIHKQEFGVLGSPVGEFAKSGFRGAAIRISIFMNLLEGVYHPF